MGYLRCIQGINGSSNHLRKWITKVKLNHNYSPRAEKAIFEEKDKAFCSNAGDSRSVLAKGDVAPFKMVEMSHVRKPQNDIETARVNTSGHCKRTRAEKIPYQNSSLALDVFQFF